MPQFWSAWTNPFPFFIQHADSNGQLELAKSQVPYSQDFYRLKEDLASVVNIDYAAIRANASAPIKKGIFLQHVGCVSRLSLWRMPQPRSICGSCTTISRGE